MKQKIHSGEFREGVPKVIEWRSGPQHRNSSLFPVLDSIRRELQIDSEEPTTQQLGKLVDHLSELGIDGELEVALLAKWLSIPLNERYPEPDLSPQRQKEELFNLLLDWLQELAADSPLLFVVEDLHLARPDIARIPGDVHR